MPSSASATLPKTGTPSASPPSASPRSRPAAERLTADRSDRSGASSTPRTRAGPVQPVAPAMHTDSGSLMCRSYHGRSTILPSVWRRSSSV